MVKEDRNSLREALIIAYTFPPAGGGAVLRTLKFCKYLPRFSWRPIVLTVKKPRIFELDLTLLQELPGEVEVYRTATLELPCFFYKWRRGGGTRKYRFPFFPLRKLLAKLFKKLRYLLLIIDERVGWVPFAAFAGWKLIKKKKNIKLIYIAVEPFSSLLAAILLKKFTHLPLAVDFRDAWTDFNPFFCNEKPGYFRRFEEWIEKMAICNADKVISVNENIIKDFRSKYTFCPSGKFISIHNGYDPEDFIEPTNGPQGNTFFITYAGSLYTQRSPESFLKALKILFGEKPFLKEKIRFRYIGKVTSANEHFFKDDRLKEVIELCGVLPHKECLRKIRESNLLLFIEDQVEISDRLFPAKIFEYVASGRPILALAKKGLTSDLIYNSKSGVVLANSDTLAIKDKLWAFIRDKENIAVGLNPEKTAVARYNRETATRTLVQVFDELIQ